MESFQSFRLLPDYHGPRPAPTISFPTMALAALDAPRSPQLIHAFRQALLLHGVDLFGLSGMTTAGAHA